MIRVATLIFLLVQSYFALAQIVLSSTKFDLGEVDQLNEDIIDLNLVNTSEESIFLLRIEAEKGLTIKYTSKNLKPNTAELLRIKLNPKKTGRLNEEIKLHFSINQEPIAVEIIADIKSIPKDNRQACPSFGASQLPQSNFQQFVKQQKAGDIRAYFVELTPKEDYENRDLVIKNEPSRESLKNEAENSSNKQLETIRQEEVTKQYKKTPEERRNSPSVLETLFGSSGDTSAEINETEANMNESSSIAELNPRVLDNSFKPNNIVFLIDASTSMKEQERMDLLKKSMINLLESLREIDYLSIVTYSGDAKVLLSPTSGVSKDAIRRSIENIVADGSTQAVKGLKKAILTGNSNFIEGGNNQIILATDGAFNIGERNMSLRRKIEKTAKDGLTITVLGIKNDRWTNKSLKEISDLGKGDLIRISGDRDAEKVLEEVKKMAKK